MDEMDAPYTFGEWIKQRRKAIDLTQGELANRAGCSVFALRKIESGERRASKQLAALLAKALQVPAEDQQTFVRVARGELNLERLGTPALRPAGTYPPPPRPAPPPVKLPAFPTPFIGREAELDTLGSLINDPQCRLLTLIGQGGIGKTRLAVELASNQRSLFPGGVYFIELGPFNSPDFIVPAMADVFGLSFSGPASPEEQLFRYILEIRGQALLLLLDNLEHLLIRSSGSDGNIEAAVLLADILQRLPNVKILVTSRERLNLYGEWIFDLQGLPVPGTDYTRDLEDYAAITLFLQSARRVKPDFVVLPEQELSLVRICHLVEGIPLAIELAAAWAPILSCQEIAQEIETNLDFLAISMSDIPERHRSLRATFDHSWKLLSHEERQALKGLSIFQGGFQRDAAEAIAGTSLHLLAMLVSKSLVRRMESGRYDLHEVIRQYALLHFEEDPLSEVTRDRHCDFYLALLRDREDGLRGRAQRETIRELTEEIDNLQAAWSWAIGRQKFATLGTALRSSGLLFDVLGWLREGIGQLDLVLKALQPLPDKSDLGVVRGQALAQKGLLYFRQGKHSQAIALFEESLAFLRPLGDPALLTDPLIFWGIVLYLNGEFSQAESLLSEGLSCARAAGDTWYEALALFNQGYMISCSGIYWEAYEQMQEGLAIWRTLGDPRFTALALNFLSTTLINLGRYKEAQDCLKESLTLCTEIGDRWGMGTAYRHTAVVALAQGDLPAAKDNLQRSLDLFNELGARWDIGRSLIYLGKVELAEGDSYEARRIFLETLPMAMEVGAIPIALDVFAELAQLEAMRDNWYQAFKLSQFVLRQTASTPEAKAQAGCLSAEVEDHLTEEGIRDARIWTETNTMEEIVEALLMEDIK